MNENKMSVGAFFQKYTMVIALVVVVIFFAILTGGKTLLPGNINNLISQNGYVFVLAAGMLLCILTGGNIDLSVGSVVCFAAAVGCVLMDNKVNMWIAVLAMLAIGLLIGAFQGFWIAKAPCSGIHRDPVRHVCVPRLFQRGARRLPGLRRRPGLLFRISSARWTGTAGKPNLTCLAIGIAILIYVLMTVRKISVQKKLNIHQSIPGQLVTTVLISAVIGLADLKLANHKGFPTVLIWIALVLGIYQYITTKTAIGRHLYAVGGNEKATALSGVKTRNVYWFAYASIGLMAGLAGILTAARAKGIDPTYGEGYEMDAIASCFIGGASAYGGVGKVSGMIVGAVLMGVINQGMNIVGVDSNFQKVVKGLVLLLAVVFDVLSKRQKR